ncbi:MAG: homoserine O-acetyltransferase [Planctomycetota bacterium]
MLPYSVFSVVNPDHPPSTDDRRTAGQLHYLQSVSFDRPLPLALGGELPGVECAYETWGTLNADASNAVLVCHAISGDSHAARHDTDDDPGWWDGLIGPGDRYAIDTERFFVVCSNVLGGCRGTTGPGSAEPATGRPYGTAFPPITVADMVELQRRLADHLGVARWRAVVGGSLGGHQAMAWATRHPERVQTCVAVATSPRLTSQALAFDVIGRNAIQSDPHFHGGQYYDQPTQPDTGLAIARMLGHITYLSSAAMDAKFDPDRLEPRDIATAFEKRFSVGSYLAHQGEKFTQRFDANSYIAISMAMDLFDLGRNRGELIDTFRDASCDFLLTSFSSDWLFTPRQSRDLVNALTALGKPVTYAEITTDAGHDAFLLPREIAQYGPLVAARLGRTHNPLPQLRRDDDLVLDLIPEQASVLDLGCGSGRLLAALKRRGHDHLIGVEVAQPKIIAAAARGLDIIDYDLNHGLPAFTDRQFDVVVLSATLQAVENVETLFDEMLRVGRRVIVSFPNFAYKTLREDYVRRGRSPKAPGEYDFEWYNTPNRRFPSIADVEDLCRHKNATIHDAVYLDTHRDERIPAPPAGRPNQDADTAVLVISR